MNFEKLQLETAHDEQQKSVINDNDENLCFQTALAHKQLHEFYTMLWLNEETSKYKYEYCKKNNVEL